MKEQINKPIKQKYQAPVLQQFGSVTELTNAATGSCHDDSGGCTGGNNAMQMQ